MTSKKTNKGFSLIEILGIVAIIVTLSALAVGGFAQYSSVTKNAAADKNANVLNSAIEQFNQGGGLMTAQVIRGRGADIPEVLAFCLLISSDFGGPFISPHQYPVISSDPSTYRVVYIGLDGAPAELTSVSKTASGYRNPTLEARIESGAVVASQFVTIGPDLPLPSGIQADTPGIVTFSRTGASPCAFQQPVVTSTPPANTSHSVALTVVPPAAGSVTGSGTYAYGASVPYVVTANAGWKFKNWTGSLAGQPAIGSFSLTGDISANAIMERTTLSVILEASPPEGGTITGSGEYNYGDTMSYSVIANTGFTFVGWTGDITGATTTGTRVITAPVNASARFEAQNYTVTVLAGVGGSTNIPPGAYIFPKDDPFSLTSEGTWSDTWDALRYRPNSFVVTNAPSNSVQTEDTFSVVVDRSFTIRPAFMRQHFLRVTANNSAWGSVTVNGLAPVSDRYDAGQSFVVAAVSVPNVSKFVRWSDGVTSPSRNITNLSRDTALAAEFTNMQTVSLTIMDESGTAVPGPHYLWGATVGTFQAVIGQPRAIQFIPANPSTGPRGARSYEFAQATGPITFTPRGGNATTNGVDMILTPTSNASDTISISVRTMVFTYHWNETQQNYGTGSWRPGYRNTYSVRNDPVFSNVWVGTGANRRQVSRQTGWNEVRTLTGDAWAVNEVQYFLGPFGNPVYHTYGANWNQVTVFLRRYSISAPGTPVTSYSHILPSDEFRQSGDTSGLTLGRAPAMDRWEHWR